MKINVHIERLILVGLPLKGSQGPLLQTAVETELARLLADGGVSPGLAAGGALPHVSASGIQVAGGNDPVQMGRQIAQSVYGGIGN
jgi:hypothetical protein